MLIPNALFAIALVALVVALSVAGLALFKRRVPGQILEDNSQAIGGTLGTISLLYAVIVGSVVASGWNRFNAAQTSLNQEASKLGDMLRMTQAFEEPARRDFQTALVRYAESVVTVEWPAMSQGQVVQIGTPPYEALWALFLDYRPKDSHEDAFFNRALGQLNDMGENRRLRVLSTQEQLSVPMWILFVAGGALIICYTYFFPSKHTRFHALKTAFLAAMFGLVLFLMLSLQFPYVGDIGIRPTAMQDVVELWKPRVGL
jgi:ABC-type multidrug transport system fused ATPase/permease subunit